MSYAVPPTRGTFHNLDDYINSFPSYMELERWANVHNMLHHPKVQGRLALLYKSDDDFYISYIPTIKHAGLHLKATTCLLYLRN